MTADAATGKLGLLISCAPANANFLHALRLAETAITRGTSVYLYLIDEAVPGIDDARLQSLRPRGLHLFACAFGAKKRNLVTDERATWVGLATASDLIASTDRFVAFN
jgi:sulfur relay (sulfurtransferase) complex TusBCD TusD component (DsrE family)